LTQYSHSRLSCFENCRKQFDFRYIQKIKVEREGIEAFVGKRVHEILERLYHHVERHGRPPSLSQVCERFAKDWDLCWHDRIEIVRRENDAEHYRDLGRRCLENYYRSHYPFDEGETVALEQRLAFRLDEAGRYRIQGIVDRIARARPGSYEIHDYKTGGSLPPRWRIDQDRQLALYQIGLEQNYPDVERVELIWHYLAFNKTLHSTREPQQLADLQAQTIKLIDVIESTHEFPARSGPLCRWCNYRDLCPEGREVKQAALEPQPLAGAGAPAEVEPPGETNFGGSQLSLLDSGNR